MSKSYIINGRVHSPYFIFIKCAGIYSDSEILQIFGLDSYHPINSENDAKTCLYLTEDANWTHLMDDFLYTLWYMSSFHSKLKKLAIIHDVFACSVGEADMSYDFTYYKEGVLVREFVVEDPYYSGGEVTKNYGVPLAAEEPAMKHDDPLDIVLFLAASLGINLNYEELPIRLYGNHHPYSNSAMQANVHPLNFFAKM